MLSLFLLLIGTTDIPCHLSFLFIPDGNTEDVME